MRMFLWRKEGFIKILIGNKPGSKARVRGLYQLDLRLVRLKSSRPQESSQLQEPPMVQIVVTCTVVLLGKSSHWCKQS